MITATSTARPRRSSAPPGCAGIAPSRTGPSPSVAPASPATRSPWRHRVGARIWTGRATGGRGSWSAPGNHATPARCTHGTADALESAYPNVQGLSMHSDSGATQSLWMATASTPPFEPLRDDTRAHVCVVGAGIAGITTAYLLQREGRAVVVVDDGPVGGGETGRTTAHLSNALDV